MSAGGVVTKAKKAVAAARELSALDTAAKNRALKAMAMALRANAGAILKANAADVRDAEKLVAAGKMTKPLLKRLALDPAKIEEMAAGVEAVARLEDPVGRVIGAVEMDKALNLYQVTCPIGVIGAVFESRPDAVPQISALCVKSGNAVILKGGAEAARSNRALAAVLASAAEGAGVPAGAIQLIETREEVAAVLALDEYIDLLVPRGGNDFIRFIKDNTKIPVLGHADGICHVYIDAAADTAVALDVCLDAKIQYPAACNAVETVLVHEKAARANLPKLAERYRAAGVEMRACPAARKFIPDASRATESDWRAEYLDLVVSIRVVAGLDDAVAHINKYGSGHTDSIVTSNAAAAARFMRAVDSACVFHNASTRFSDGFRFGKGAEIGISTNKTHARGPVGLDGLVIYKYLLFGDGQTVARYSGPGARKYSHKKLPHALPAAKRMNK